MRAVEFAILFLAAVCGLVLALPEQAMQTLLALTWLAMTGAVAWSVGCWCRREMDPLRRFLLTHRQRLSHRCRQRFAVVASGASIFGSLGQIGVGAYRLSA